MRSIGLIYMKSEFESLEFHTKGLEEALKRAKVPVESFYVEEEGIYPLMQSARNKDVAHFFSFKGIKGGAESKSIQNMFDVPFVPGLVEFSFHSQENVDPRFPVVCIDQKDVESLKSLGYEHPFFLPLGAKPLPVYEGKKDIEISFFGNIIDPEEILQKAEGKFCSDVLSSIKNMVEYALHNPEVSHYQLFSYYIENYEFDAYKNHPYDLFCTFEYLMRSLDRIQLLQRIKKHQVNLYGIPRWERGWGEILSHRPNIKVCGEVSYSKAMELMGRSKLSLNSSPHLRYGVHDRLLYSLMLGTPCLSSPGAFIKEHFDEGLGVSTYSHEGPLDDVIEKAIQTPKENLLKGREIVLERFSWDVWVKNYLRSLPDAYKPQKDSHSIGV